MSARFSRPRAFPLAAVALLLAACAGAESVAPAATPAVVPVERIAGSASADVQPTSCPVGSTFDGTTCVVDDGYWRPPTSQCSAGYYDPEGQNACVPANPGYYVPQPGAMMQIPCPLGTYQPNPGQSACIPAAPGYFVGATGATAPLPCPAGSYQPLAGQTSCLLTPMGTYTLAGATVPVDCAAGFYQPDVGKSACLPASAGFYVPTQGATMQLQCSPGSYQPNPGQVACLLAPIGTYVAGYGATAPTSCPAGTTTVSLGSESLGACTTAFSFGGILAPIDPGGVLNVTKAGTATPVKFSLGGAYGLNVMQAGFPSSQQIACNGAAALSALEETVNAGGSSLSYDATTGLYTYVWKSEKSWAGTCRRLTIRLTDGTTQSADFKFR